MSAFVIQIFLAILAGALFSVLLGWVGNNPPEPFDWRKLATSAMRAIAGAVAATIVFDVSNSTSPYLYFIAFVTGYGLNTGGLAIAKAVTARSSKKIPPAQ